MTSIPTTPDEARDFLRDVRSRIDDIEARLDATKKWKDWAGDEIRTLREENDELRERLDAFEARLEVVEDGTATKEGKVRAIVQFAKNHRDDDQPIVLVTPREIVGATGVSERYAYKLCDADDGLPAEYHWVVTRRKARQSQYGHAELDDAEQTKALGVHFERLQQDPAALNKFNNGHGGEGAE